MAEQFKVTNPEFLETLATRLNNTHRTAVLLAMDEAELREIYNAVKKHTNVVQGIILTTIHSHKKLSNRVWSQDVFCIGCEKKVSSDTCGVSEDVYTCEECWT